jgi:hypothetical protein
MLKYWEHFLALNKKLLAKEYIEYINIYYGQNTTIKLSNDDH